jgi:hypothetical protein
LQPALAAELVEYEAHYSIFAMEFTGLRVDTIQSLSTPLLRIVLQ